MLLSEIDIEGQWGLALIADADATDALPDFGETNVTATRSSIVIAVIHPQEGTAHVTVSLDDGVREQHHVYSGELDVASGSLVLCTADFAIRAEAPVEPGTYRCDVYTDRISNAERVSVVIADAR